jgi:hypothetical protein
MLLRLKPTRQQVRGPSTSELYEKRGEKIGSRLRVFIVEDIPGQGQLSQSHTARHQILYMSIGTVSTSSQHDRRTEHVESKPLPYCTVYVYISIFIYIYIHEFIYMSVCLDGVQYCIVLGTIGTVHTVRYIYILYTKVWCI